MEILSLKTFSYLASPAAALALSPLLAGIINRTKAVFAGRKGQPLLQCYYDLLRLFSKGSVYSKTTSWIFRIAPAIIFFATLAAVCFVPVVSAWRLPGFSGDLVLILYLLGLARFFIILSALDTGSAFEGMGASREAFFSALAEPVMFVCLINVMRIAGTTSFLDAINASTAGHSVVLLCSAVPVFLLLLAENSRIPFDDPNTHLELTMIHEVMILDNSGQGLALMEYAASLKLWLFSLILARLLLPVSTAHPVMQAAVLAGLMALIGIAVGVAESCMARVRLLKVPQLLFGGGIIAMLGFFLSVTNALSW
jgi:formate hydrogenlyase subunit 4